jgi:hypothetical protein
MNAIIDYTKENSKLTGSIIINEYAGQTTYIAVIASACKTYKSLKGAEKFMNEHNYKKC